MALLQIHDSESMLENFDGGTSGIFGSLTDSGTATATITHYAALAAAGVAPFKGDYVARWALNGSDTSFYADTSTSVMDSTETWHLYLNICVEPDFTLAASDILPVWQLISSNLLRVVLGIPPVLEEAQRQGIVPADPGAEHDGHRRHRRRPTGRRWPRN